MCILIYPSLKLFDFNPRSYILVYISTDKKSKKDIMVFKKLILK